MSKSSKRRIYRKLDELLHGKRPKRRRTTRRYANHLTVRVNPTLTTAQVLKQLKAGRSASLKVRRLFRGYHGTESMTFSPRHAAYPADFKHKVAAFLHDAKPYDKKEWTIL